MAQMPVPRARPDDRPGLARTLQTRRDVRVGGCASRARRMRQPLPALAGAVFAAVLLALAGCAKASRSTASLDPGAETAVNDYAGVIPDATKRALEDTLRKIRTTTEGEIVLVTFADLAGFTIEELARRMGNEWGVGARIGRARNAGAVVLLIPKESSTDGRGHCRIELCEGAAAFISDSVATSICVAATPSFRRRDYAGGLRLIALNLADRYTERSKPPR